MPSTISPLRSMTIARHFCSDTTSIIFVSWVASVPSATGIATRSRLRNIRREEGDGGAPPSSVRVKPIPRAR